MSNPLRKMVDSERTIREQAARIAELEAENERLKNALTMAADRIDELEVLLRPAEGKSDDHTQCAEIIKRQAARISELEAALRAAGDEGFLLIEEDESDD